MQKLFVVLLALVALASIVANAGCGRRDLYTFCEDLSKSMKANPNVYTNPREAFKTAKPHLNSIMNIGVGSRSKLAKAWELVINEKPCDEHSHEHVYVIGLCMPEKRAELATLDEAVRAYAAKCLTIDFWDRQLVLATGGNQELSCWSYVKKVKPLMKRAETASDYQPKLGDGFSKTFKTATTRYKQCVRQVYQAEINAAEARNRAIWLASTYI